MYFARNLQPRFRGPLLAILSVATTLPLAAQIPSYHSQSSQYTPLATGSPNEATADPTIPRPNTKHCEVTLLTNQAFANFNNETFNFTPPADCPGPWAKVIFTGDLSIQAGNQFDRTGFVFFGGVNIFYGTTAEPLQSQTNSWHVERDLTDYSSLFKTAQTGYANIGNIVGEDALTSTIFGTFKLEFYQADFANPAPRPADAVLPVPTSGVTQVNNTTPEVTQTVTLPTNVESAYIDLIAESQFDEEQWFFCVPNTPAVLVSEIECGNTAFRQVGVSIDGKPAGVAPVYPWIYTGGINPGLWTPIPGVQTLNFIPYRVDLTPFAGVLSNGQQHTVGITVYNAFNYFNIAAALLIYEDHGSKQVTGSVTEDNLTAPNPTLVNNESVDSSGNGGGTATVTNAQKFTVAGYVNTSHGRVETTIDGNVNFSNVLTTTATANSIGQSAVQSSTVNTKTTTRTGPLFTTKETTFSYPFTGSFLETIETNNDITLAAKVDQNFKRTETNTLEGFPVFQSNTGNEVASQSNGIFVPSPTGYSLGSSTGKSSQTYVYKDSLGNCYSRQIAASNGVLNTVNDGQGCHQRGFGW
jgi:hypothetical protein